MDHGWIRTFGYPTEMTLQVSFAAEVVPVPRCRTFRLKGG